MQTGHKAAHLDASVSVVTHSSFPVGPALTVVCTALCVLALYALLTPANFGPIAALMLLTLAVGFGKAIGVPAAAFRGERSFDEQRSVERE